MAQPPKKNATYDDLHGIPENTIGEIIDGELTVTPRPSKQHVYAASVLEIELGAPINSGAAAAPAAGSFWSNPKSSWEKISSSPILRAGRRNGFRGRKQPTGFRPARTGCARCSHWGPSERIRSRRCRSMDATACSTCGSSTPPRKPSTSSAWNRTNGSWRAFSWKTTRSERNRFKK